MDVKVIVDEGYCEESGISLLYVSYFDREIGFSGSIIIERKASPEKISETLKTNAYYLDENPPDEFYEERNGERFALIEFYKEAAKNVPGLRER
jgi:hypothetical protein